MVSDPIGTTDLYRGYNSLLKLAGERYGRCSYVGQPGTGHSCGRGRHAMNRYFLLLLIPSFAYVALGIGMFRHSAFLSLGLLTAGFSIGAARQLPFFGGIKWAVRVLFRIVLAIIAIMIS